MRSFGAQQPAAPAAVAAIPAWPGHSVEGKDIHMMVKCMVCLPALCGADKQEYCLEMLHWDDWCTANNAAPVGTKSMKDLFESIPFVGTTCIQKKSGEIEKYLLKCIAIADNQCGAPVQDLNQDMIHYDDYVSQHQAALPPGVLSGGSSLASRFAGFYGHTVHTSTAQGESMTIVIECMVAEPALCGAAEQNFSTEMLHWDDYCEAQRLPPSASGSTMKHLTLR